MAAVLVHNCSPSAPLDMKLARKLEVWLHVVNTDECTGSK